MIDIPIADIIAKITEQKGVSEEDVRKRITEKLRQLAGLISEEGAAHIVANELGVELVKTGGEAKIKDLYPGMRSVSVPGRVTRKFEVREFDKNGRKGKVASFFIGDETGQIRVTLWNEQTDVFAEFAEGDIVRVKNGYVKENRGYPELHLNAESKLELKPSGVTVGDVPSRPSRPLRERKNVRELTGAEENVELLATVVQLYDPRYFDVCPECNKRVTEKDGIATCAEHGNVTPVTNYVVSAFLDDGTGNIRTTFWKRQTQRLLDKTDEEMLQYKENPAAFEPVKTELLGKIIKVVGRCRKNETFDRIELTANLVFTDVDPEEELARLAEESESAVEKTDASAPVKEAMKKTIATAKEPAKREEKQAKETSEEERATLVEDDGKSDATDTSGSDFSEEAISLDDLEDLDEKL